MHRLKIWVNIGLSLRCCGDVFPRLHFPVTFLRCASLGTAKTNPLMFIKCLGLGELHHGGEIQA